MAAALSLIVIPAAAFFLTPSLLMIFMAAAVIIFMVVMPLFLVLISPVIRSLKLSVAVSIRIGPAMLRVVVFPSAIR